MSYPKSGDALAPMAEAGSQDRDYADWALHAVRWSADAKPRLVATPVGPEGFNVVNFAVSPSGSFIYWPQTRDADEDRVWDANGVEDVNDREACHHIMACRVRNDGFSDPFIVADLPNDTDALTIIDTGLSTTVALEALRTELVATTDANGDPKHTDAEGRPLYSASHIWHTTVPAVRCVTAVACEAPRPFVSPGGRISFHVAVRNDGNTYVSGCTLTLCAEVGHTGGYERVAGASASILFGPHNICESTHNHDDGAGGLTGLEPDYALAPGKTSVYGVTVSVPSDWESGERRVLFVASDAHVAPNTARGAFSLHAQDDTEMTDEDAQEFHIEPGEYRVFPFRTAPEEVQDPETRHMETLLVDEAAAEGDFSPAPVTVTDGDEDAPPSVPSDWPERRDTPSGSQGGAGLVPGSSQAARAGTSGALGPHGTYGMYGPGRTVGPSIARGTSGSTSGGTGQGQTSTSGGTASSAGTTPGATGATGATGAGFGVGQTTASAAAGGTAQAATGAAGPAGSGAATQTQTAAGAALGSADLPGTADASVPTGLGVGLAAAGAALIAYERRRARGDRDERDS